ncbi:MAG: ABC transporter ATP-binding protein [Myxococcales bacterium]|nr:ABC transporter ATP-binding protein [Myxococcales bacterium]
MSAASTTPAVVCDHVSKWYGRIVGVNDINANINAGVTGLLGPNGAGKSTLLRLLRGALRPSKGKVTVLGEGIWGNRALLARIGHCPEHDGVYGDLSGLEFVTVMARLSGMDAASAEKRAGEALDRLGLADARHRPVGQYSKGMRQRVKLAQAIVHDPELLLFDEPLTGCDPVARAAVVKLIRDLGRAGKTVIVSSHILHEVESMTEEILLIYKGQVLAEGNVYRIREMIDEHPHQIRVDCDNPRALASEAVRDGSVHALSFPADDALLIETRDPDSCYPLLPRLALEHGVKIRALTSPDNNLQAVFDYLTRDRGPKGVAQ